MTETTPRREITRQRLVDAAIVEFAERGIDATSVEMLCEAAGFTRGAFYSNFSSKDDLCAAVLESYRDQVVAGLAQAFAEPPEDASLEWATGDALNEFFAVLAPTEHFQLTLMEIRLRATRTPELAERLAAISAETRPEMVRFIDGIGERLGLRFRLRTDLLVEVFEALFFQEERPGSGDSARTLIGPVALALAEPAGDS